MAFNQFLDRLQPPLTPEQKARAISDHEIKERRALVRRSVSLTEILDWEKEHPTSTIPKVGTIMPKTSIPKTDRKTYD
jgi:hypothetical protein